MTREELAQQLDAFGFARQAEECRTGKMTEDEAKGLIFACRDVLQGNDRAHARHLRKQAKKQKKKDGVILQFKKP